jgi:iron complex outermembrane receptor protein
VVGDISLKQQITPTVTVFGTYARGYAPKAYNTAGTMTLANPQLDLVGQTSIDHFEIGTKGRYFGNKLAVDVSAFDTTYHNYQIQVYQTSGAIDPPLVLTSAGELETKGVEAQIVWKPTPGTIIGADGAYTYSVFNQFKGGPCYWGGAPNPGFVPDGCYFDTSSQLYKADLSGKSAPNAPRYTFRITADQEIPMGSLPVVLTVGGDAYYRGSTFTQADHNIQTRQTGFAVLNLHATLSDEDGNYSLTLFANNVTNTHYNIDVEDFWDSPWGSNAVVVQPARDTNGYFGARLSAQF